MSLLQKMLNNNIYTTNEESKVKFSKIFVGAKSVFLKSVGAAAPTLTRLLCLLSIFSISSALQITKVSKSYALQLSKYLPYKAPFLFLYLAPIAQKCLYLTLIAPYIPLLNLHSPIFFLYLASIAPYFPLLSLHNPIFSLLNPYRPINSSNKPP